MKIQDFKPFDKVLAKDTELIILASVIENSTYNNYFAPKIYRLSYIEPKKIHYGSAYINNIILTKDSELNDWERIGNVREDFECEIFSGGTKDQICKTKDKEFSEKDWNDFFLKLSSNKTYAHCYFEPSGRVGTETVSKTICEYVEDNIGKWESAIGYKFGYYRIHGETKKVIKIEDKVYFIKKNGSLGSFVSTNREKFKRNLKKTFHFSTEHARIWLRIVEQIYINKHANPH